MKIIPTLLIFATLAATSCSGNNEPDQDTENVTPTEIPKPSTPALADCVSLRSTIVSMYSDRDLKVIKIYDPKEITKTDKEIRCTGRASWSDASTDKVYYRQYLDEDDDAFASLSIEPFSEPIRSSVKLKPLPSSKNP